MQNKLGTTYSFKVTATHNNFHAQYDYQTLSGINVKFPFQPNHFVLLFTGMSKNDLLEMQRIMRERQQEDYKKKAGMKLDETKGVRYQTIQ